MSAKKSSGSRGGSGKGNVVNVKLINYAIQEGVQAITKGHPRFKGSEEYIANHIDHDALGAVIEEIDRNSAGYSDQEKTKYFVSTLASYVASGELLDDAGKNVILNTGLEERANKGGVTHFFSRLSAGRRLEGQQYLDNVIGSFDDLYKLFQSGNYSENLASIAQDLKTIKDMGFLDVAIDSLASYGLLDDKKYSIMKKALREKVDKSAQNVTSGIEEKVMDKENIVPQKIAAGILEVFGGILLVLFGSDVLGFNLTGNAISNSGSNAIGNLFGFGVGVLFVVSSFLIFKKLGNNKKLKRK
jgi:hypothetical protein